MYQAGNNDAQFQIFFQSKLRVLSNEKSQLLGLRNLLGSDIHTMQC